MSVSEVPLRLLTHALTRPETAVAAAEALRGVSDQAAVEGLVELIAQPSSARAAVVAIAALGGRDTLLTREALAQALESPHASVRVAAAQAMQERPVADPVTLARLLRTEESWPVRQAAVEAFTEVPAPERWLILEAATDPHWRVRHALIQVLLEWGETKADRDEIDQRLASSGPNARVQGVRDYLRFRWYDVLWDSRGAAPRGPFELLEQLGDGDPAVLVRHLEGLGESGRRQEVDLMPGLLDHADERVRRLAVDTLRRWGEPRHIAQALTRLDEPRTGAAEAVFKLLGCLDLDQVEAVARLVFALLEPSPSQLAWALDQVGAAWPVEEAPSTLTDLMIRAAAQPPKVRAALARLASRWPGPQAERWLKHFLVDSEADVQVEALRGCNQKAGTELEDHLLVHLMKSKWPVVRAELVPAVLAQEGKGNMLAALAEDRAAQVRRRVAESLVPGNHPQAEWLLVPLQEDAHPHVRAAALTPAVAATLIEDPTRETSWHVLAHAARMSRVPLWRLEPEQPWQPPPAPPARREAISFAPGKPAQPRVLGPSGLVVSALGVSGHYGLPVKGFVRAIEAGVNLLFWEPNYQGLTEFATRLSASDKRAIHFIAGTFEADGKRVRRDVERALRLLQLERLDVFLIFWVRSWDRITSDVGETLERLKDEGKIATFGLSTHSRPLAIEAIAAGWDPVMVRHSAAHRGAEEQVFPTAVERGTSLITFNNTCYGRLLQSRAGSSPPSAVDCYRYTLAQPGVTACLSAPATLDQLEENLRALHQPTLPPERRERLQAHGALVYQEESAFRKLVRSR
jgi:HEAT repeat protein